MKKVIREAWHPPVSAEILLMESYLLASMKKAWSATLTVEAIGDAFHVSIVRSITGGSASSPINAELLNAVKRHRENSEVIWFRMELRFTRSQSGPSPRPQYSVKERPKNLLFTPEDVWLDIATHELPLAEYPTWFQEEITSE